MRKWDTRYFTQTCWAVVILMVVALNSGCRKDPCEAVSCVYGTCVEGNCICQTGYEGGQCDQLQIQKFWGSFQAQEQCTAGSDTYPVQVFSEPNAIFSLKIIGLWEVLDTLEAVLAANGFQFVINRQNSGNVEIAGTGTFQAADSSLSVEYEVYAAGASNPFDHCQAQLID